jgi:PAS domain S-box-containing protein
LLKVFVKSVPAGVAMFDCDMRYVQASDRWCADYSVNSEQLLGRSQYEVMPDMPSYWKEMHERGLRGETLQGDDRWVREDGTVKWIRWEICPWKKPSGVVGGILVFAEDITDRKRLEQTISELNQKLIISQETERTRIARELHDDIGQRLTLMATELELLRQDPELHSKVYDRLAELRDQSSELVSDVQALSHSLHSSKLEYLGVASAMKSFCREFGEHQKMEIDFQSRDLPDLIPPDISLALFRVFQEALHNSAKHSGVKHVEVRLWGRGKQIELTVQDSGVGFEVEAAKESWGLGLINMQERLKLVNGQFSIESQLSSGTTIHAQVPLPSGSEALHFAR